MFNFNKKRSVLELGELKTKNFTQIISFDFMANLPIIEVQIEEKTYKFLFDTGALSVVPQSLVSELSLEVVQEIEINDSKENLSCAFLYTLPSLKIGELEFTDYVVVSSDFSKQLPLSCLGFDGIFGYNFLSSLIVSISYEKREIVFCDKLSKSSGYIQTPLLFDGHSGPRFEINFPFRNISFVIDSGKNDGISLAVTEELGAFKEYAKDHKVIRGLFSSSFSGTKEEEIENIYLLENFNITKNIVIKRYPVSLNDGLESLVGNSFLKNFDIILDFKKNMLYLKQLEEGSIEKNFNDSFGFFLHWDETRKLYISALSENSVASNSGLKLGDRILALDGEDTYEFTKAEYCELFLALNSNEETYESLSNLELTIKTDSTIKRVLLKNENNRK